MSVYKKIPYYYAVATAADGTEYHLKNATQSISISEAENSIAAKASISIVDTVISKEYLHNLLQIGMKLYIFADDGERNEEIFRGVLWSIKITDSTEQTLDIVAYDKLIYLQQSKHCTYFSAGYTTESILQKIASDWGFSVVFAYRSIRHTKLQLDNKAISDMFIEVLDEVKKQTGIDYCIRAEKDTIYIKTCGDNATVYCLKEKQNTTSVKRSVGLDKLVNQVIITGKSDEDNGTPIEATVTGTTTAKYGTVQAIVNRSDKTLDEAKTEAEEMLNERQEPTESITLTAIDIPWIHKGDKINLTTQTLTGDYIVQAADHDASGGTMSLEVKTV